MTTTIIDDKARERLCWLRDLVPGDLVIEDLGIDVRVGFWTEHPAGDASRYRRHCLLGPLFLVSIGFAHTCTTQSYVFAVHPDDGSEVRVTQVQRRGFGMGLMHWQGDLRWHVGIVEIDVHVGTTGGTIAWGSNTNAEPASAEERELERVALAIVRGGEPNNLRMRAFAVPGLHHGRKVLL